jgi:hypothetical protein
VEVHAEDLLQVLVVVALVVDVVTERGVVDEDVDPAELLLGLRRAGQRRRLVGDVGLHERGVAELLELLHRRGGAVLVDLGHDDLRALVEEAFGVREADALARAGDDRDPVVEPTHVRNPPGRPAYER